MKYAIVPVTGFEQNCSLLWCETSRKAAVVDPGGDIERILRKIEQHGLSVEKILLTHAHIDHAGGTADLAERLGVPVEGPHQGDRFWIEALPQQASSFGFPSTRSFEPDRWLDQDDEVTIGELRLQVLHCPGHTPGHLVFYHPPSKLAVVGDVLFDGSIGRTDFPGGDYRQLINAIRGKLFPLGDDVTFLPGHGPRSTFGEQRRHNPFVSDAALGVGSGGPDVAGR